MLAPATAPSRSSPRAADRMTAPGGYYDASYPPELWETPAPPVGAARPTAAAAVTPAATLVVAAGAPGSYSPELRAADRPRNVTELREQATPVAPFAWLPGQYILVGENGKRAHWDGTDWQRGEAVEVAGIVPVGTVERSPAADPPWSEA